MTMRDSEAAPPSRCLVTGGAGFIGSHICERLLKAGRPVVVADDLNGFYDPAFKRANLAAAERTARATGSELRTFIVDAGRAELLEPIFASLPIGAVIHLAASAGVQPSLEDPAGCLANNAGGVVALLETMRRHGTRRLIFASSSSVYGDNPKKPFAETDRTDDPVSPYAASKKAGELLARVYHGLYGLNVACLRFFTVYGPRQRPDLAIYKFTDLLLRGRPLPFRGDGESRRDYTFIDDIADGLEGALAWLEAAPGPVFEIFNLGGSRPVTLKELVAALEKATGRTAELERQPGRPGDVEATWADIEKAGRLLNYAPATPLERGLAAFVDWFKRERAGAPS